MDTQSNAEFTIGALAHAAGVGVETIRYYQRRGLLAQGERRGGAYRSYGAEDLSRLRAIRRAQQLGFALAEIAELLSLSADSDRERARAAATAKIEHLDGRIAQMQGMRAALAELVRCCEHGDPNTPCPILRALSAD